MNINKKYISLIGLFLTLLLAISCICKESYAAVKLTKDNIMSVKMVDDFDCDTSVDEIESFTFGTYPNTKDGKEEPIEWIALERKDGKLLVMSKYIIDCKCYNHSFTNCSWKDCVIRNWLNNDFYNKAFSDEEKKAIQTTSVKNDYTINSKTYDIGTTNDKVFILDDDEILEYFGYEEEKEYGYQMGRLVATHGTDYAKNVVNHDQNLWVYNSDNEEMEDDKDALKWANGNSPFWLRSQGEDGSRVMYVKSSGYLSIIGEKVDVRREGIRPAMWIKY